MNGENLNMKENREEGKINNFYEILKRPGPQESQIEDTASLSRVVL